MRVRSFGMTDVGLIRVVNEDDFAVDDAGRIYIVADGMGGHNHGEVASGIAVNTMRAYLADTAASGVGGATGASGAAGLQAHTLRLKRAVEAANSKILAAIRANPTLLGMGSTVVSAMQWEQTMAIAHVGDSRAYRRREGKLELLTHDHSFVNDGVRAGELTQAQARVHPLKNIVTRALGGEAGFSVDVTEVEARPGDLYMLCSDGLTTMLTDRQINRWLVASEADAIGPTGQSVSLKEICRGLIQAANALGGFDNVTVVLIQIVPDEDERKGVCS